MRTIENPAEYSIAVLAGGISGEREVSLASGASSRVALDCAGFSTALLDPAKREDLETLLEGDFDVVFLCLHGKGGEDGAIQGFLETVGLPHTGSGICASAIAMNKLRAKTFYREAGIPTAEYLRFARSESASPKDCAQKAVETLGEHCVVKAPTEGSSIGLFITQGVDELQRALEKVFALGEEALVEQFVTGRELTVAVLGNEDARALPIIEIVPRNEFYDYDAKYAPGGSTHICPAELSEDITARVRAYAEKVHRALGCRGMSRSDFILDGDGNAWILETNTVPGMTETSLLPDAARAVGMEFPELCKHLVELALAE